MDDLARVATPPALSATAPQQAATDAQAVGLWLHGRPARTEREYRREVAVFLAAITKPLQSATLGDVQAYADRRRHLAPSTQARTINTLRSLFRFLHTIGYLPFNVALPVKPPAVKNTLAERILSESDVYRLLHRVEGNPRNYALLLLAYASGGRVSELAALKWRDVQPRGDAGQVTIFGKGGKTRTILLPAAAWRKLQELGQGTSDTPVFRSRAGGHLSTVQVWRIVRKAASDAGILAAVSPHFLRHAHASHALDRQAPIHLVQQTLGHASLATTSKYTHSRPNDSSGRYLGLSDL
ncbi:MAG: tyrosine-type recombinase/integrase [Chloroflexota bacterium]